MASRTASEVIDFMELGNLIDEVGFAGLKNKPSGNTQKRILQLAHLARGRWAQLAAQKLHSSQRKYLNALGVAQAEDYGASVTLEHESSDGRFAKMVEWGSAGQDMRKTLLDNVRPGAKGVKTTKDGVRYRIIPFRRMTGDATGRNFPTMGGAYDKSMGQTASNAFRNSIVNRLKAGRPMHQRVVGGAIDPKTGQPINRYQTTSWGTSIKPSQGGPKLLDFHKTGLYSGMYRIAGKSKNSGTQYLMFRTVKEDSPGWQQGPITARKISEDVLRYINEIAPEIVGAPIEASIE